MKSKKQIFDEIIYLCNLTKEMKEKLKSVENISEIHFAFAQLDIRIAQLFWVIMDELTVDEISKIKEMVNENLI